MKKLSCSDLGGPRECQVEVSGKTFEETGNNSKKHVMEMVRSGDKAHQAAIERMMSLSPEAQQAEFASYKQKFDEATEI